MIIPHINENTRDKAMAFVEAMAVVMSKDKSHQDGLGYAAIDSEGNLFAERWLVNSHAFNNRAGRNGDVNDYAGFIKTEYNKFGDVKLNDVSAITLHTRLATSGKGLLNCHPFIEGDTSVIHNGVISNAFDFRIEQSTCDSESILTQYIDNNVGKDFELFNKVSTQLEGYYACGIFSRDQDGKRILDIVKSSSAQLVGAYIDELQCVVFTSLESQLREGLKMSGLTTKAVYNINPSSLVRVDPLKNIVLGVTSFTEFERSYLKLTDAEMKANILADEYEAKTGRAYMSGTGSSYYDIESDPYYYNDYPDAGTNNYYGRSYRKTKFKRK